MLLAPLGLQHVKGHSPCSLVTPNGGSSLITPHVSDVLVVCNSFVIVCLCVCVCLYIQT